jgi:hypothetical protein
MEVVVGYYVRAFCTAEEPPTVRSVLQALESRGVQLTVEDDYNNPETLDTPDWQQFGFLYKPGKRGILVECNRHNGSEDCLAAEESKEFVEMIGPPGRSKQKKE